MGRHQLLALALLFASFGCISALTLLPEFNFFYPIRQLLFIRVQPGSGTDAVYNGMRVPLESLSADQRLEWFRSFSDRGIPPLWTRLNSSLLLPTASISFTDQAIDLEVSVNSTGTYVVLFVRYFDLPMLSVIVGSKFLLRWRPLQGTRTTMPWTHWAECFSILLLGW